MKAKLLKVQREDQTVNLEVEFFDEKFSVTRTLNIHNPTWEEVQVEVKRIGQIYSDLLTVVSVLETKVGTTITI